MAKLGESYVAIQADLTKFDKDLDKSIKAITDRFEKSINREFGKRLGTDLGAGTREGLRDSTRKMGADLSAGLETSGIRGGRRAGRGAAQGFRRGFDEETGRLNPVSKFLANMVSAIEDGFSALPAEVKAAVGAGLVAAVIPLGAMVTAAIGTGVIAGVAGLGTALAFQFTEMEERGQLFIERLRIQFVSAARPFIGPLMEAFDMFENRLGELDPVIRSVFDRASQYVEPLTNSVMGLIEGALEGLDRGLRQSDLQGLTSALEIGFEDLGITIGESFETLLSNPNLDQALLDLLYTTSDFLEVATDFLDWTVDAWDAVNDLAEALGPTIDRIGAFINLVSALTSGEHDWDAVTSAWAALTADTVMLGKTTPRAAGALGDFTDNVIGSIKPTEDQSRALQELNREFERQYRAVTDVISTNLDYQESLEKTLEAFERNGTSLAKNTEIGRENQRNILASIKLANERANAFIATGQMTNEKAKEWHDQEIARLREEFRKRGGNIAQFDAIFGKLTKLGGAPPIPDKFNPATAGAFELIGAFGTILSLYNTLRGKPPINPLVSSGNQAIPKERYADGGFVTQPTFATIGEGFRPELVLPLTKPSRSMQLLNQAGIGSFVGGNTSVVAIFDGEPFQARIVRTARGVTRETARTLSQAPRMF